MLIDDNLILHPDSIRLMAEFVEHNVPTKRLRQGVYQIGHFNLNHILEEYDEYPDLNGINCYGVCDSVEQLLEACPELETSQRRFVVSITPVVRADQDPEWGWRWHKWGPYIGNHQPQHEYLYDEVGIEAVYVYQVFEAVK